MERDAGIISLFKALGYKSSECLRKCKCDELPCPLLTWLVSEIKATCTDVPLPAQSIGGAVLVGELRAVLNEMSCPQNALTSEHLSPPLMYRITEFLVSELLAARMLMNRASHPEETEQNCELKVKDQRKEEHFTVDNEDEHQNISQAEYKTNWKGVNKELTELFHSLGLKKCSQLSDACAEVESRLADFPDGKMPEGLLMTNLNSEQWKQLHEINKALCKDYECRRQMMIKRFDVTLQSFAWGEKGKERNEVLSSIQLFTPSPKSSVSIATLLAAREDQSRISPVKAGPSTAIHKMLMGDVPDRGGRPGEIEPPMPSFTSRRDGGSQYKKRRPGSSGKKKNKQS
ncbi:Protein FAM98B [Triplophysa tibetana]|uniref:Protein FAM98B n=1 Tax=Triplophysa tibetana TaxID=1572043 RepID=A0A5A9P5Q0_9TELE|nr:Protein FAM98B [Triplophysa tibetana]